MTLSQESADEFKRNNDCRHDLDNIADKVAKWRDMNYLINIRAFGVVYFSMSQAVLGRAFYCFSLVASEIYLAVNQKRP